MSAITIEIDKCRKEIAKLKHEIEHFDRLRFLYLTKQLDMYVDYPDWRHPIHRTPLDWVEWKIHSLTLELGKIEKKLHRLITERDWFEVEYCPTLDLIDICEAIRKSDSIKGTKL